MKRVLQVSLVMFAIIGGLMMCSCQTAPSGVTLDDLIMADAFGVKIPQPNQGLEAKIDALTKEVAELKKGAQP